MAAVLRENLATILVSAVLLGIVALVVRKIVIDRQRGALCNCGCGCDGCPGASVCRGQSFAARGQSPAGGGTPADSKQGKRTGIPRILEFAGKYRFLTLTACLLSGISAILALFPFVCVWMVVRLIFEALPGVPAAEGPARYGWTAAAFALASIIVYFVALMCSHLAAFRVERNMKSQALHHIATLPLGFFNANTSGKLRKVIDESVAQTEGFLAHQLPDLVGALVTPIAVIVMLFVFDWRLGLLSLAPLVLAVFFLKEMMGGEKAGFMKTYQDALEKMTGEAVEYVRGIPVVKVFQQTVYSFTSFHDAILEYMRFVKRYAFSCQLPMTCFTVSVNGAFALLIPAGILLIASASDYKRFLVNLIFYILFTPFSAFMMTRIMYASEYLMVAKDALGRIEAILDEKPLPPPLTPQKPKDASVELSHVTFTYPGADAPALRDVSFSVPRGATVALVGPSGSGKTTAASLIPRFWDVQHGSVRIGGVDVRQIDQKDLMNCVSFVFQNARLFKTSVLENIRAARPDASREDAVKAAEAAQCGDILEKLPRGIDTVIGAKGVFLSGGEQQRIALARAILKDAPIVVLDEATAFADPENEHRIQLAFKKAAAGKTVLVIAHRLSTVRNADRILVMRDGSLVEQGTHEELTAMGGVYAAMWKDYETAITWKVGKEAVYAW